MDILKGFGALFYVISPAETAVEHLEDVPKPNYIFKAIPYMATLIALEYIVQIITNKRRTRINDGITSIATGLYILANDIVAKGAYHYFYIKVYENWRVVDLPWDSPLTWWLAAIVVDFAFYWLHRAAHETNFLWAHHQVHHSSEDFNITTASRQPGFQIWFVALLYLPVALFVPPPLFIIHQQFNLLFQVWIHTEVVESLGPLEWVLNTAKHHRVHHGSNRYCLDKNYAGWLIIWDRLFGTFEEEKPTEKIVYGLVEDVKSFNPFYLQFMHVPKIWGRMKSYDNWKDKMFVLLKGPGWTPGKPRLGDLNDVPIYPVREVYDVKISTWRSVYALCHFSILLHMISVLVVAVDSMGQVAVLLMLLYILSSLTSIGFVLEDRRTIGIYSEIIRSVITALFLRFEIHPSFISENQRYFYMYLVTASAFIWLIPLIISSLKPSKIKRVD